MMKTVHPGNGVPARLNIEPLITTESAQAECKKIPLRAKIVKNTALNCLFAMDFIVKLEWGRFELGPESVC